MTFLTAYLPLVRQARVGPGSVVLVHAAAGRGRERRRPDRPPPRRACRRDRRVAREAGIRARARRRGGLRLRGLRRRRCARTSILDPVGGEVFARSLRALEPLGTLIAIGYAGGMWADLNPALVVGRNVSVAGFYLGRLMGLAPAIVQGGDRRDRGAVGTGRRPAGRRRGARARRGRGRARPDRGAASRREGRPCSVARSSPAAASGIGAAAVALLEREGVGGASRSTSPPGSTSATRRRGRRSGAVDFAFLNAGVATGSNEIAELPTRRTGGRSARTSTASSSACGGWRR